MELRKGCRRSGTTLPYSLRSLVAATCALLTNFLPRRTTRRTTSRAFSQIVKTRMTKKRNRHGGTTQELAFVFVASLAPGAGTPAAFPLCLAAYLTQVSVQSWSWFWTMQLRLSRAKAVAHALASCSMSADEASAPPGKRKPVTLPS